MERRRAPRLEAGPPLRFGDGEGWALDSPADDEDEDEDLASAAGFCPEEAGPVDEAPLAPVAVAEARGLRARRQRSPRNCR